MRSISLITLILSLACCVSCGRRTPIVKHSSSGTPIEVSDSLIYAGVADTFNLGKVRRGEMIIKEFSIINAGNIPFIVSKADSDCGCMVSEYEKHPIKPKESMPFSVSFDSRGYYGYIIKRILVSTTLNPKPVVLYLEAEVE